jgi:hypothetical protein
LRSKILKHKRDHTRLGCAASCILENLFIVHRVASFFGAGELRELAVWVMSFQVMGRRLRRHWEDEAGVSYRYSAVTSLPKAQSASMATQKFAPFSGESIKRTSEPKPY